MLGILAVALVATAALTAVTVAGTTENGLPTATPPTASGSSPVSGSDEGEQVARRLEAALNSGDPVQVANAVRLADSDEIEESFVDQLEALDLRLDSATFIWTDPTFASIEATSVPVEGSSRWLLLLYKEADDWLLSSTVPLP